MNRILKFLILIFFSLFPTFFSSYGYAQKSSSIYRIAFGSCNNADLDQSIWKTVLSSKADMWVWVGDSVYGDGTTELTKQYNTQKKSRYYQKLFSESKILGTWDDHDFGENDGNKNYIQKFATRQLFLDFLEEPYATKRRVNPNGIYESYIVSNPLNPEEFGKLILLDERFNRGGSILGATQWRWLEKELKTKNAKFLIVASSTQAVATEHRYDSWGDFPADRKRLLKLVTSLEAPTLLLSGDRHFAELSVDFGQSIQSPLIDFTSSGMTHIYKGIVSEKNSHRIGSILHDHNFGSIDILWSAQKMLLVLWNKAGSKRIIESISFAPL
jgi:alkaline phosphatase D